MHYFKAILTGSLIWIFGISLFLASTRINLFQDSELQSNLFLAIGLLPAAWLGSAWYYRFNKPISGVQLGLIFIATAIFWDVVITVPFFMAPYGVTHIQFFGSLSFWLIALEYFLVVFVYRLIQIQSLQRQKS